MKERLERTILRIYHVDTVQKRQLQPVNGKMARMMLQEEIIRSESRNV